MSTVVREATRNSLRFQLRPYQEEAVLFLQARKSAALFLDMGLGKTAISLSALTKDNGPTLVVAPKRVAEEVWPVEAEMWRPDLSVNVVKGERAKRMAALRGPLADITVISRDTFKDVTDDRKLTGRWSTLILDELSGFKNRSSLRWKTAMKVRRSMADGPRVWGLTGTPAPNGLLDLWGQIALLDDGAALGRTLTMYRERYFIARRRLPNGVAIGFELRPGADAQIHSKLGDLCLSMGIEGRVHVPEVTYNRVEVPLPGPVMRTYQKMRETLVADLDELGLRNVRHTAVNAASLTNRLSQISAGFMYPDEGSDAGAATPIHKEKIAALKDIIEEAQGSPVLVFYRYREEAEMIKTELAKRANGGIHVHTPDAYRWYQNWNEGKIRVLMSHPASIGHGLNLQHGGHTIVWTSLPWGLEEWQQGNTRLARSGQTKPVVIHKLMSPGTVDYAIESRLEQRRGVQDALMDHLEGVI